MTPGAWRFALTVFALFASATVVVGVLVWVHDWLEARVRGEGGS